MISTMAERQLTTAPPWRGRSRWALLVDSVRGSGSWWGRIARFFEIPRSLAQPSRVRARFERLRDLGYVDQVPTLAQALVAGRDQIILSLGEETKVFYRDQGIPWTFHNWRRWIAEPGSMTDPIGFLSHRDTIIHHILQTFHRHAVYDFVLLQAHEGGLEELDKQLALLLERKHPQSCALWSLIEDGSYYGRLVPQVKEFIRNPQVPGDPLPDQLLDDPYLMIAMDQFKDVRGFCRYASRLPVNGWDAFLAWLQVGWNATLAKVFRFQLGPRHLRVEACDADFRARYFSSRNPLGRENGGWGRAD